MSKKSEIIGINCTPGSRPDDPRQEINFQDAINYIWNYVNEFPDFPVNAGAASEICRSHLKNDFEKKHLLHCGLLIYFCYDMNIFSFAFKVKNDLLASVPEFPILQDDPSNFFYSDSDFKYDKKPANPTELTRMIVDYNDSCICSYPPFPAYIDDINKFGNNFKNKINNRNKMDYPIAFFHKDQISAILKQNDKGPAALKCTGIRFYWGYEEYQTTPENPFHDFIKLIAFGIDGYGNNIINKFDGSPGIILEQSWPPSESK